MRSQNGESPWPDGILDIPIQGGLELDIRDGTGELGPFYRAHGLPGPELLTGMTLRPDEAGGQEIETLIAGSDTSFAATAVHRILTKKLFSGFSGVGPNEATTHIAISRELAGQNDGAMRAFYDFAFAHDGRLIVPMPNKVVIRSNHGETGVDEDREALPDEFTGVFAYVSDKASNEFVEEFYRRGTYLGKIVEVHPEDYMYEPAVSVFNAAGEAVDLGNKDLYGTAQRVHFLKTLAENDPELEELIVAG